MSFIDIIRSHEDRAAQSVQYSVGENAPMFDPLDQIKGADGKWYLIPHVSHKQKMEWGLEGTDIGIGLPRNLDPIWNQHRSFSDASAYVNHSKAKEEPKEKNKAEEERAQQFLKTAVEAHLVAGNDPNQSEWLFKKATLDTMGRHERLRRGEMLKAAEEIFCYSESLWKEQMSPAMRSEDFPLPDKGILGGSHCMVLEDRLWLFTIFESIHSPPLGRNPYRGLSASEETKTKEKAIWERAMQWRLSMTGMSKWPNAFPGLWGVRLFKFLVVHPALKSREDRPSVRTVLASPRISRDILFKKWFKAIC